MPTASNCSRFFDYPSTEEITLVLKWDEKQKYLKNSADHYVLVQDLTNQFFNVTGEKMRSRNALNSLGYKEPFQVPFSMKVNLIFCSLCFGN